MKQVCTLLLFCSLAAASIAQSSKQVQWNYSSKKIADKTYEVHLTATVGEGYHIYAQNVGVDGPLPTKFTFTKNPLATPDTKTKENGKLVTKKEPFWGGSGIVRYYENTVDF